MKGRAFAIEYFDTGALILRADDARMIRLNPTGAEILRLVESGRSEREIVAGIGRLFGIADEEAAEALESVRSQLMELGVPFAALRDAAAGGESQ